MLRRYYWWIGMDVSTRWWLRRSLKCQAHKTSRQTIRWPRLSLPIPIGPGILVSVDYFGPLPITLGGNSHILLSTDRFSRRAEMYAAAKAEFTASDTADILVDRYIPLWGCPSSPPFRQWPSILFQTLPRSLRRFRHQHNCHELLPSFHKRWCRERQPHHGSNARHGGRRTPNRLGHPPSARRERL